MSENDHTTLKSVFKSKLDDIKTSNPQKRKIFKGIKRSRRTSVCTIPSVEKERKKEYRNTRKKSLAPPASPLRRISKSRDFQELSFDEMMEEAEKNETNKSRTRSLPSVLQFSVSKENLVEEFGVAVKVFQSEMKKACEFGRKLVEENKKIRDELQKLKETQETDVTMCEYERDNLENTINDLKIENTDLTFQNEDLKETILDLTEKNDVFKSDFDRVIDKNKVLREQIFDLKKEKYRTEKSLKSLKQDLENVLTEKHRLKKRLSAIVVKKEYFEKEKEKLNNKLIKSESTKNLLLIQKKAMSRKIINNSNIVLDVDLPPPNRNNNRNTSSSVSTSSRLVTSRKRSATTTFGREMANIVPGNLPNRDKRSVSAKNLKNFVLMKNVLKNSFHLTKAKKDFLQSGQDSIRFLRITFVKLRVDTIKATVQINDIIQQLSTTFKNLIESISHEKNNNKDNYSQNYTMEFLDQKRIDLTSPSPNRRRGSQVKPKNEMNYALLQMQVISDLGLTDFYEKQKSSHQALEGYVQVSSTFLWKTQYLVLSSEYLTVSFFTKDDKKTLVKRYSMQECRVEHEIKDVRFLLRFAALNVPVVIKAQTVKNKREFINFIQNCVLNKQ